MKPGDIEQLVSRHDRWVNDQWPKWAETRDAYADDFWREERAPSGRAEWRGVPVDDLVEINRIRPWVFSYVASLFYKALHSVVQSDPVANVVEGEPPPDVQPVTNIVDRFLNERETRAISKRAFSVALMYPHAAFHLVMDARTTEHPVNRVRLEFMPPWECVWDRRARSRRELRFIGRLRYLPYEAFVRQYGANLPPDFKCEKVALPDVARSGEWRTHSTTDLEDENYVRVLQLFDYTDVWRSKAEDGAKTEAVGVYRVFHAPVGGTPDLLHEGPFPFTDAAGAPLASIEPIVLCPLPEYELWGTAPVRTVYELNRELNMVASWNAQAFRKEAARKLLYKADALSEQARDDIQNGVDQTMTAIEGDAPLDQVMRWLEQAPMSPAVLAYRQLLDKAFDDVQGTAPASRGTPTKYVTATESERLNDYTETLLGLFRESMDQALGRLSETYLRVLAACMEDAPEQWRNAIHVRVLGNQTATITAEDLDRRWLVSLVDAPNTPMREQRRRMEVQQAMEPLSTFVAAASSPEAPPETKVWARRMYDLVVKLYDLPDDLSWSRVEQDAAREPPPPPPEPPPQSGPPGGGGGPADQQAAALAVVDATAPPSVR
jgi:hypothetical protein